MAIFKTDRWVSQIPHTEDLVLYLPLKKVDHSYNNLYMTIPHPVLSFIYDFFQRTAYCTKSSLTIKNFFMNE